MKKTYKAPATTTIALHAEATFMTGSLEIKEDKDYGFNEDNDETDWLSNKKRPDNYWGGWE